MSLSSCRRAAGAALIGTGLLLIPRDTRAAPATEQLHLSYDAPAGCPTRQDFLRALASRIQNSWVDASDPRSFDVRIVRVERGGFAGRLEIRQAERPPSAREIRGESCEAVTISLAVFVAIALDPASRPAPASPPPVDPNRTDPPSSGADELPRGAPPEGPREQQPSSTARTNVVTPKPAIEERSVWTFRAGYSLTYLRAPETSLGGRVHAELGRGREHHPIALSLRGSWGWSDFSTFPPVAGEAHFRFKTVRVEACVRIAPAAFVAVAGCGGVDVGSLTASTPDLPVFERATTPWTAGTGALRAALSPLPWLAFELSMGALVPFERPSFEVTDPSRFVYRAPAALLEGSAGLVAFARFR